MVTVLPAPPVRGVGRTGGFKFMVEDRGDLGLTALQQQADNLNEKGNQQRNPGTKTALADDHAQRLPRQHAAALRGHEPPPVHVHGRFAGRRLQYPADLPGLAVRQRLQPLRPHLAGERPGRRQLPQPGRGRAGNSRCGTTRARWSPSPPSPTCTSERAADHHPLQHVPGRGPPGRRRAPASVPARPSTSCKNWPTASCRTTCNTNGPSWPTWNSRRAIRRWSSSGWPCWWCSWSWPRSTRAGPCRWP